MGQLAPVAWAQENWSCHLPAASAGGFPHPLPPVAWEQERWPWPWEKCPLSLATAMGEMVPPLTIQVVELTLWYRCRRDGPDPHLSGAVPVRLRLVSSAITQAHIQGFELAHSNIYSICDLLERVKGVVLWNHSLGISMTQGNSRILEKTFCEGPVLMMYLKPEALNHTNKPLRWAFATAFQLGLVEGEINDLLRGIHQVQSPKLGASDKTAHVKEDGCLKQKAISAEDICPICQEVMLEKKLPVTFCR
ncbi:hypothetical protein NN561_009241 [Cricetulus griseus]